jgi:hypothetical protein
VARLLAPTLTSAAGIDDLAHGAVVKPCATTRSAPVPDWQSSSRATTGVCSW